MSRREIIQRTISDLALDFVSYDRKSDEELPRGSIEEAIVAGEVSVDEMVDMFADGLVDHLCITPPEEGPDEDAHFPTLSEIGNAYEHYVVAMEPSEYHGDQMGEEVKCPKGYLVLVDAEQKILGFAPEALAHTLAKALNLAACEAVNPEENEP